MESRPFVQRYFAGSFSGNGFSNHIIDAIKQMKKIYIIKGTPGSGKSTLMKRIAESAEAVGENVEYIHCSSDSKSLDGIVIPTLSIAMVDGTAPHVIEASYPIAVETVINTADYLSHKEIEKNRDRIIALTNEKKKLFSMGEKALRAASALRTLKAEIAEEYYNSSKGFAFCERILKRERKHQIEGDVLCRSSFAFGKNGISVLSSFPDAEKTYSVDERVSTFVLGTLKLLASEFKIPAIYSPDPINPTETASIYFPLSKKIYATSYIISSGEKISGDRFAFSEKFRKNKEKLKFIKKTEKMILDESQKYLSEAMERHVGLEKIYTSAMNKEGLDCLSRSLILSLFDNAV